MKIVLLTRLGEMATNMLALRQVIDHECATKIIYMHTTARLCT